MKKILVIFGTRPEAIKMAPVIMALKKVTAFNVKVCVTAQHREMLDQVLTFFKIDVDYDLNLMKPNQSLNQLSSKILNEIDTVLIDFNPDIVLVHGDTTTSSMTALASFHRNIKVGHIEAGLRTYDKTAPFPEELNRQITGRIADYHFAPTQKSASNLVLEKVPKSSIYVTGNTVVDALLWGIKNIDTEQESIKKLQNFINPNKKLIVVTGHRRENFGLKFESFCAALNKISERSDVQIIYPVHLNPNVQKVVYTTLNGNKNILLLAPLDYEAFIWLLDQSYLIITDSGGIQEEAPSLGKPVLVTRDVTERQEAVEQGTVKLVGTNAQKIIQQAEILLNNDKVYKNMSSKENPYGDGHASERIVNILVNLT